MCALGGKEKSAVKVVLACDTRESGLWITDTLAAGASARGGDIHFGGVLPTPAVAYLTRHLGAEAGVVVSASHNPWQDNGIKIFSAEGKKLADGLETLIEDLIPEQAEASPLRQASNPDLYEAYVSHLCASTPHRLDGMRVVLDAANGAAHRAGPDAFRRAGAEVIEVATQPTGHNINEHSGAVHPARMAEAVVTSGADLGIALDGDADRILMADSAGRILDGDDLLYLFTLEMEREGRKPSLVVGTVMTNWGLERALSKLGVGLVRAAVGDRYVAEEMTRTGAPLGGEPSGHLIHQDFSTTGDGILTGLVVCGLIAGSKKPLSEQPRITRTPQVLKNIKVRDRVPFDAIPGFIEEQHQCETSLRGSGRILLRYSGTERLARVMVEGTEAELVETIATRLAGAIGAAIGQN